MIRVLTLPERSDAWLVRTKDAVSMDVPGGRVTLVLDGGWSESGIAYTHLRYEPLRAGLVRFGHGPRADLSRSGSPLNPPVGVRYGETR
jgi:hypothetical protein